LSGIATPVSLTWFYGPPSCYSNNWQRRNKSETAFCHAANYSGQLIEVIRVLLEFGADPNVVTISGESSPLVLAVMTNDIDLAELLLDAGADINTTCVLTSATEDDSNYDIVNFLIRSRHRDFWSRRT
jgi:ankyrin repeat protein